MDGNVGPTPRGNTPAFSAGMIICARQVLVPNFALVVVKHGLGHRNGAQRSYNAFGPSARQTLLHTGPK